MDWSGVDNLWIIVMFLSAVWTLILTAPIHCRASTSEQLMECYIYPNLMKKQTHLHLGWPEDEYIFRSFSFMSELFNSAWSPSTSLVWKGQLNFSSTKFILLYFPSYRKSYRFGTTCILKNKGA